MRIMQTCYQSIVLKATNYILINIPSVLRSLCCSWSMDIITIENIYIWYLHKPGV